METFRPGVGKLPNGHRFSLTSAHIGERGGGQHISISETGNTSSDFMELIYQMCAVLLWIKHDIKILLVGGDFD